VRDPKVIEAELRQIMSSEPLSSITSQLRQWVESVPEDEQEYGQWFMAQLRAAAEDAFRRQ